jgi:hypothetical protein
MTADQEDETDGYPFNPLDPLLYSLGERTADREEVADFLSLIRGFLSIRGSSLRRGGPVDEVAD